MAQRIAMISEHASPLSTLGGADGGGQNVYVAQLALHLGRLGFEVDIFTRRDNETLPGIVDFGPNVRVIHVPAGPAAFVRKEDMLPYMTEFTSFMLWFMESQQGEQGGERTKHAYDLIHANFWMSGLVAADLKRATGIPFAITFHALGRVRRLHQGTADGFPDERFAIEDRLVAEADAIIAECPQDEQDLRQLYHADPRRIRVIPCGFDPAEFWPVDRATARARLGIAPSERVVLQLGRMVPRKGVDTVIRGLARLVKTHHIPARLIIVGGEADEPDPELTPEIGRLMQIAAEEDIAHRVEFTGRRTRDMLKYYYSAANVFVTMPWYEPFGMTVLEAMACGTPVIGADVGGVKYSVVDGETGYLVPPQDADALADRLAHLFQQPELLARFSYQALTRCTRHFTWDQVAASMASLFQNILAVKQAAVPAEDSQMAVISGSFDQAIETLMLARQVLPGGVAAAAQAIQSCLSSGGKVLICGNGGSAADAQHFAGELVGRFKIEGRVALPVIALTADSAILTAWANDMGFDKVFSRQVEALGRPGDLLIGISTSGRSANILEAFATARSRGLTTLAISGGDGGKLAAMADLAIVVPARDTPRIQEVHIVVLHMLCELVESRLVAASIPAGYRLPVAEQETVAAGGPQRKELLT